MIVITVKGLRFEYRGRVELISDETFVHVQASATSPFSYCDSYDAFWLSEVESIMGEANE